MTDLSSVSGLRGVREALAELFELVESGELVRDISRDGESDWLRRAAKMTLTLKKAQLALSLPPSPQAPDNRDFDRPEGLYLKFSEPLMEPNTPVVIERVNGDCTVSQFIIARDEAYELIDQLRELLAPPAGAQGQVQGVQDAARAWLDEHKKPNWSAHDLYSLIRLIQPADVSSQAGERATDLEELSCADMSLREAERIRNEKVDRRYSEDSPFSLNHAILAELASTMPAQRPANRSLAEKAADNDTDVAAPSAGSGQEFMQAVCKCGHSRATHFEEPPYACPVGDCDCEGFEYPPAQPAAGEALCLARNSEGFECNEPHRHRGWHIARGSHGYAVECWRAAPKPALPAEQQAQENSPRVEGHRLLESDLVGWWGRCSCGWYCEFAGDWTGHLRELLRRASLERESK